MGKAALAIKLSDQHQQAAYDPKKGWAQRTQPVMASVNEYHEFAQQAAPALADQMRAFCETNGFSFITISHDDFYQVYELSGIRFRPWLQNYCKEKGLNPNVDFALIGPCVKPLSSADRKTKDNNLKPEKVIDYLRSMMVALRPVSSLSYKKDPLSLNTLSRAMCAMESDERTVAQKNYYYDPHDETGFRAHKSIWEITVPEGNSWEGFPIDAEIKLEHEDQMDIDKLTRNKFVGLERATKRLQERFDESSAKEGYILSQRAQARCDVATEWGRILYNRVFEDAGINAFLNPDKRKEYAAMPPKAILQQMKTEVSGSEFPSGLREGILTRLKESGVLPSELFGCGCHKNGIHDYPTRARAIA